MKRLLLLPATALALFALSTISYSQGNNWRLNGNMNTNSSIHYLGTSDNEGLSLSTNTTQRLFVNADNGSTDGYVGIGNNFSDPASLLHVNGVNNATGNLFQTTGAINADNTWLMSVTSNSIPRFFITNPANSNDVNIGTAFNGAINFSSNGFRCVSIQEGLGQSVHGQVALGNNLPPGFDAQSRLHLHKSYNSNKQVGGNFIQFTNEAVNGSSPSAQDGIRIGQSADGRAEFRQWESQPLQFFTGPTNTIGPRLHINSTLNPATEGFIGINTSNPSARLDINGNLRIRDVQEEAPDALFVGIKNSSSQDLSVRRLDFPNDPSLVLLGDGTWGSVPNGQRVSSVDKDSLIDALNRRLTELENCLNNLLPELCRINSMAVEVTPEELQQELRSVIDVNLSNTNSIVLNQNVPNPFSERTVITYVIPETVVKAQIHFYDGMGKLINSVDITERGSGQINVFANDLSTGIYTYSLVADGLVVATKRMMRN